MASSPVFTFVLVVAFVGIISMVQAAPEPCPEPSPAPMPEPAPAPSPMGCGCGCGCGCCCCRPMYQCHPCCQCQTTTCGALVVPTLTTVHSKGKSRCCGGCGGCCGGCGGCC